jgi:hypothetical protein
MPACHDSSVAIGSVGFVLLRRVLGLLGVGPRADAKDVEIAVLRHQLMVLRRQVFRPRYTPSDRLTLAVLAKLLPRERWSAFLITPAMLLRWHRDLVRRRWTYPSRQGSQHGLDPSVVDLVLRMARENSRWGYQRIAGECAKLGIQVSSTSMRNILRRHRPGPAPRRGGPSWTQFLVRCRWQVRSGRGGGSAPTHGRRRSGPPTGSVLSPCIGRSRAFSRA